MTVSLISAMSKNRVIGKGGTLPWDVPEDMKFFMRTTLGHAVIMGRKTYDSMGKPLPRRRNIVVTRSSEFHAEGTEVARTVEEAIALARSTDAEPFVIGGAEIYKAALPLAQRMYITYIPIVIEGGDTFFPEFTVAAQGEAAATAAAASPWREVLRRKGETEGVEFVTYER